MRGCQAITDAVSDYFRKSNLAVVEIDVLQPADPFLDMVGEDLRRRIFMTQSETGDSLCLRPEFTIPVCLHHIASRRQTPQLYAYQGEVFRQKRNSSGSFYQAGIEELGAADETEADARSLAHATAMLAHLAPDKQLELLIGDHAIFAAVLAALDLPPGWQKKMLRCFGNDTQLRALLGDLAKPAPASPLPTHITRLLHSADRQALTLWIEQEMLDTGISPTAGRTPKDIATRLMEKQALADRRLEQASIAVLDAFLGIDIRLDKAVETLRDFAGANGLDLEQVITRFAARADAIARQGLDLAAWRYHAAFGRALDYYTGFVYEIRDKQNHGRILAGGGRYDRLLTLLGAGMPIPAVGFSVGLDWL